MSVHTRERKRLWCRLFGHGETVLFWSRMFKVYVILCPRCGRVQP